MSASDEPLELGEPDKLDALPLFVPRAMYSVLAAVLAEVARQDVEGTKPPDTFANVVEFYLWETAFNIGRMIKLRTEGGDDAKA